MGIKIKYYSLFLVIVIVLSQSGCTNRVEEEIIIARVGDKTISENEFIERAEYTIRPPYCKDNSQIHKAIILNSLIAEKLMALEAGEKNEFITSKKVLTYLRGRKEQAMRQIQFSEEIIPLVKIDSAEVNKFCKFTGREYQIKYVNLPLNKISEIKKRYNYKKTSLEEMSQSIIPTKELPKRIVKWNNFENDLILDSLFSTNHKVGDILGPIKINEQENLYIQIEGWVDNAVITDQSAVERKNAVIDKLYQRDSNVKFEEFVISVMKGKEIKFNGVTFNALKDLIGPQYFLSVGDPKVITSTFHNVEINKISNHKIEEKIKEMFPEQLFTIDGKAWTVKDYFDELDAHPLVFRKQKILPSEFALQFKLAIVDMVRDTYLNKLAYKKKYDEDESVKREVSMWKDNMNYNYYLYNYLHTIHSSNVDSINQIAVLEKYLTPLVYSLQKKYSDKIEINVNALEKIELTRIDMTVSRSNAPFRQVVPLFPIVTTDSRLNYGRKMN